MTLTLRRSVFLTIAVTLFSLCTTIAHAAPLNSTVFSTTWDTSNPGTSNGTSIIIPLFTGETYDYSVSWEGLSGAGMGTTGTVATTTSDADLPIDFGAAGVYRVDIIADAFPRIYFNGAQDEEKILTIEQWGDTTWSSMERAFQGTSNLTYTATDAPDLSIATNTADMFNGATVFDGDISSWDVSNIISMEAMFSDAEAFNQNISGWTTSNVTNMYEMFRGAEVFHQPLNSWDVSSVTNMGRMFSSTFLFNQPLDDWDVSSVTNMSTMFFFNDFNQNINNWDVSSVTSMAGMFDEGDFNQPLSDWDVSSVTSMNSMFYDSPFNQDISEWDTSSVTDMNSMFLGSLVFNQDISEWDTSSVLDMSFMFTNALLFNQPVNTWDVSSSTNMSRMFEGTNAFNQPIDNWNTESLINASRMFEDAVSFNQAIGTLNLENVTDMNNILLESAISPGNFTKTLIDFAAQATIPGGLAIGTIGPVASPADYDTSAASSLTQLETTNTWTLTYGSAVTVPKHTITYAAGSNAAITGSTSQQVFELTATDEVTVVPDSGYTFSQWSDSNTDNPRQELSVTATTTYTAAVTRNSSGSSSSGGGGSSSAVEDIMITSLGDTTATVVGTVEESGTWDGYIIYSTTDSTPLCKDSGDSYVTATGAGTYSSNDTLTIALSGLTPSTKYYFRLCLTDGDDIESGDKDSFTTLSLGNTAVVDTVTPATPAATPSAPGLAYGPAEIADILASNDLGRQMELVIYLQDLIQTLATLQAQQSMLSTVQQNEIRTQNGRSYNPGLSTGNSCSFYRNLTLESEGSDVVCLQAYLRAQGFFTYATNTGFFGEATRSALANWQARRGISPAVGYFGPVSMAAYRN